MRVLPLFSNVICNPMASNMLKLFTASTCFMFDFNAIVIPPFGPILLSV